MSPALVLALLGLTVVAVTMLLVPLLWRRHVAASREAYNLRVYKDQLAELERDRARGLLGPEEERAARSEIGRRILALAPDGPAPPPPTARTLAAAATAVLLLPLAAWLLYARLGTPALPDQPFAARAKPAPALAAASPLPDMAEALSRLAAHLKEHPEDLDGWLLLGRSELGRGRYPQAADAYRHAAALSGQRPKIVGDWGEVQVLAAGGTVTAAAEAAFATAAQDPENAPRSRYYLALAQMQRGNIKTALEAWVELAAQSPKDAEWLPLVRRRIAEARAALGIDPAKSAN